MSRYQAGKTSGFDNRVLLKPGVGEYLQMSGLLRPLIQRRWAAMVAELNRLEDSQLEVFLFGADRTQTTKIRAGLWEIQGRRCFYCQEQLREPTRGEVDHFVPWSRYPDDSLDNLVVADKKCNGYKSSSLAAVRHLLPNVQALAACRPDQTVVERDEWNILADLLLQVEATRELDGVTRPQLVPLEDPPCAGGDVRRQFDDEHHGIDRQHDLQRRALPLAQRLERAVIVAAPTHRSAQSVMT